MILHFSQIGFTEDLTFIFFTPFEKSPLIIITKADMKCKNYFSNFYALFSEIFRQNAYGERLLHHFTLAVKNSFPR